MEHTAVHLETRDAYPVPNEDEGFAAWREGRPLRVPRDHPERRRRRLLRRTRGPPDRSSRPAPASSGGC
ncbi:DUF6879 family protein [Streptomyces sp. NPDC051173]|uniref:DUF6879 family protein n=1 Tax=Streptomyces sp. NPDC051173 TaxID=3155164 RepID=UPI00344C6D0A